MKRKDFLEQVARLVDEIPMTEVFESRGIKVHGAHLTNAQALCPFHGDSKLGSFRINNSKKVYKCFTCLEGGASSAKFVSKYEGISFSRAVMAIARDFNIITNEQYNSFFKRKFEDEDVQEIKKIYFERQVATKIEKADVETLHNVYSVFSEVYSRYTGMNNCKGNLSEEHYKHLRETRMLSDEEIKQGGYFTMPNRRMFMTFVTGLLQKKIIPHVKDWRKADLSSLKGVPGFYQYKETERWTYSYYKGIGIPIRDVNGKTIGVQVRKDEITSTQSRYIFFSSSFAQTADDTMNGTGVGVVIDAIIPNTLTSSALFITEGRFKSQMISNTFRCASLSLQGIGSWSGIEKYIQQLIDTLPIKPTTIYIAFDSDMCQNPHVAKAAIQMTNHIQRHFPWLKIVYTAWDMEYGKGIDDMMLNGHRDKLSKMPKEEFDKLHAKMMEVIERREKVKTPEDWRKIPKEKLTKYYNHFILSQFDGYKK